MAWAKALRSTLVLLVYLRYSKMGCKPLVRFEVGLFFFHLAEYWFIGVANISPPCITEYSPNNMIFDEYDLSDMLYSDFI